MNSTIKKSLSFLKLSIGVICLVLLLTGFCSTMVLEIQAWMSGYLAEVNDAPLFLALLGFLPVLLVLSFTKNSRMKVAGTVTGLFLILGGISVAKMLSGIDPTLSILAVMYGIVILFPATMSVHKEASASQVAPG